MESWKRDHRRVQYDSLDDLGSRDIDGFRRVTPVERGRERRRKSGGKPTCQGGIGWVYWRPVAGPVEEIRGINENGTVRRECMNRRAFLEMVAKGGGAVIALVIAVPLAITALSPVIRRRREEVWVPVGMLEEFPMDTVHKAVVEIPWNHGPLREKGVFVWRRPEREMVVMSRSCTDLSCPVTWDPGSGWFFCPCHGGIFDHDGVNVAGPPPRPLDRFAVRWRDNILEIDLNSVPPVS